MYGVRELYQPETIEEALNVLAQDQEAKVIAGGTDLLLKMRYKGIKDLPLVSLRNIKELHEIKELPEGVLQIGAMVTFSQANQSPLIREKLNCFAEAAVTMGGPQIQNVATIGGNLCNGAPSADSAPLLFALEAKLVIESLHGSREVPIEDFYLGPSKVDLRKNELLSSIKIPLTEHDNWGGFYYKYSMRKAMDISTLGCAVVCEIEKDGRINWARVALGTAAPTPIRCRQAEGLAANQYLSKELLTKIGQKAAEEANPRSSWRASREFRLSLIEELTARTLVQAYVNAGGEYQDE